MSNPFPSESEMTDDCCCVGHAEEGDCLRCPTHGLNDHGPHGPQSIEDLESGGFLEATDAPH